MGINGIGCVPYPKFATSVSSIIEGGGAPGDSSQAGIAVVAVAALQVARAVYYAGLVYGRGVDSMGVLRDLVGSVSCVAALYGIGALDDGDVPDAAAAVVSSCCLCAAYWAATRRSVGVDGLHDDGVRRRGVVATAVIIAASTCAVYMA